MATEQDVVNAINASNQATSTVQNELNNIKSELNALVANPDQPDAAEQYALLTQQLNNASSKLDTIQTTQQYNVFNVYGSSSPEVQAKLKESFDGSINNVNEALNTRSQTRALATEFNTQSENGTTGTGQTTNRNDDDAVGSTTSATGSSGQTASGEFTRPRKNPLGNFATYAYQLTLYMITPDAYDAFVATGRKSINALRNAAPVSNGETTDTQITGGAFIIAQSGGINQQDRFNPNFKYDYYIDRLSFKTHTSGESEFNSTEFSFDIIEPYGFSFLSNLRRATEQINALGKGSNRIVDATKQFYILGIRFFGYDSAGNLISGKDTLQNDQQSDINFSGNGLFERFYDIVFTKVKFKLDGKATVYNINAATTSTLNALTIKRGSLNHGAKIKASTVEEAINQLIEKMNQTEKDTNPDEPRNIFKIAYIGNESEVNRLKSASIIAPNDNLKSAWGSSKAKKTSQSNEIESVTSFPDSNVKELAIRTGTFINDAIAAIIKQSQYLISALDRLYAVQQSRTAGQPAVNNPADTSLTWYNLSVSLANARFSEKLNDWTYEITYVIQPYYAPAVYSPFISQDKRFYGPHKTYEYYFTGQNSEIISYDQSYNSTYFTVALNKAGLIEDPNFSDGSIVASIKPGGRPDAQRTTSSTLSLDAQNQVLTSLYDVGALVSSKLTILGDPDYLMSENPNSLNGVYQQFYDVDNYSINPNGGQVFVEVDFKEAVDYDTGSGFMSINEDILFYKYPSSIKNVINGVIFQIIDCVSTFDKGKFIQVLTLSPAIFNDSNTQVVGSQGVLSQSAQSEGRQDTIKEAEQADAARKDSRQLIEEINTARAATEGSVRGESTLARESSGLTQDELSNLSNVPITSPDPISLDRPTINLGSLDLSTGDD